jgi:hypothetical protein
MRRCEFVAGFGGVVGSAVVPLAARAQRPAMPAVGILNPSDMNAAGIVAIRKGRSGTGYVEGQNVAIEYRRLPALAARFSSPPGIGDDHSRRLTKDSGEGSDRNYSHRVHLRRRFGRRNRTCDVWAGWKAEPEELPFLRGEAGEWYAAVHARMQVMTLYCAVRGWG